MSGRRAVSPGREAAHRDEGPGMPVSARGICRAEHSAFLLLLNMFLVHKGLKGHSQCG